VICKGPRSRGLDYARSDRDGPVRRHPSRIDAADAQAVALAEERFRELTGTGFRVAALSGDGSPGKLHSARDGPVIR